MNHWLLHVSAAGSFAYAIYFNLYKATGVPGRGTFGGQWKYLTYINMWIQLVYFSLCIVNNLFGSQATAKNSASGLQRARDFVFATVAFPIGQFVGLMFWTLYAIDRDLVFPVILDKFFPPYVNHLMHTTVIPLGLVEMAIMYHIYPPRKCGIATSMMFCFAYLAWIMVVAVYGGIWVYPILKVLEPAPRAAFLVASSMLGGLLYLGGEALNKALWAKNTAANEGKPSKYTPQPSTGMVTRSKRRAMKAD